MSGKVVHHFVIVDVPKAPHPDMAEANRKLVGAEKGISVMAGKVTAGDQHWACGLDRTRVAGRLFEGALHQATDHPPLVTCEWCMDTPEYKDALATQKSFEAQDGGIFSQPRAAVQRGAVRPGGGAGAPKPG